ncbi:IclR family transcriptional regulator [Saccharopolyspora oryzae]|uniref:IclR family transcriptional regulator n=1 Tax=Saccharopolyspora oryzae TaxID=2997343 RepID=A0ABT4V761_9PSEU|nr:IclR family transcriptional regulator [Saccharopolyspora oryzae]MDA3629236.1 IclR family transcriptional regulator [Saccharopolyspora oryzae]
MGITVPPAEAGAAKAHRTVSRVTTILELAAAHRSGVRLAELATALDAPRSSVHGLVKGLVATGYLREEGGAYRIGPAINSLLAAAPPSIAEAARPAMERLHRQFDETIMLATLVGDSVVYTDTIESTDPIRFIAPLQTRRPLHPTSSGKCILAFGTERFREGYLTTHLPDPVQQDKIRRQLEEVAQAGVAINSGETLPDRSGVGAPIFDKGKVTAAIAVAGPINRLADKIPEIAEATKAAAHEVSERLAGRI